MVDVCCGRHFVIDRHFVIGAISSLGPLGNFWGSAKTLKTAKRRQINELFLFRCPIVNTRKGGAMTQ